MQLRTRQTFFILVLIAGMGLAAIPRAQVAPGATPKSCAGAPVDKTLQAEELLGTAGFQLKMADTPAKFERISRIPQKQVVRGMVKDHEVYVWADAVDCRCYYAGTRQNYEQMLQIRQANQAQYRINLYDAQGHDPLWSNTADWEDDLLGRH